MTKLQLRKQRKERLEYLEIGILCLGLTVGFFYVFIPMFCNACILAYQALR